MAEQTDYEIGATAGNTTKLDSLTTAVNPPRGRFKEWTVTNIKANALTVGHGYPSATWQFDWLDQDMVDQLRTFCSGVASKVAYIVTRLNDGSFAEYSCVMHWPANQLDSRVGLSGGSTAGEKGIYQDITIEFTKLVAV